MHFDVPQIFPRRMVEHFPVGILPITRKRTKTHKCMLQYAVINSYIFCILFTSILFILCRVDIYYGSPRVLLSLEGDVESMCSVISLTEFNIKEIFSNKIVILQLL